MKKQVERFSARAKKVEQNIRAVDMMVANIFSPYKGTAFIKLMKTLIDRYST
jgi:uncharacterized protein (UPF0335 family)